MSITYPTYAYYKTMFQTYYGTSTNGANVWWRLESVSGTTGKLYAYMWVYNPANMLILDAKFKTTAGVCTADDGEELCITSAIGTTSATRTGQYTFGLVFQSVT